MGSDANGSPNGTGRRPPEGWTEAEKEVIRLLESEGCSLRFLGHLKLTELGRIQRAKLGITPAGGVGSQAVRER